MIKRNFILGDEWLYYKIYSGAKTSDLTLTEVIEPVSKFLLNKNSIDKWFFIRYADPKHHLRLRFHYNDPKAVSEIINSLRPHFIDYANEDLIWKIQIDIYNRELERYGSKTMTLSETLFFQDSVAITEFLSLIEGDEGENLRWLFGLRMIDVLLNCFSLSIKNKYMLLEHLKTGFGNEFGINRFLKKQLDDKYRKERENIESFLVLVENEFPDYNPILDILLSYKVNITPIANEIVHLNTHKKLEVKLNNLLSSYIHMTMNRLFKSKNRVHELVVYDFLYRYYKSALAKSQYKKKKRIAT